MSRILSLSVILSMVSVASVADANRGRTFTPAPARPATHTARPAPLRPTVAPHLYAPIAQPTTPGVPAATMRAPSKLKPAERQAGLHLNRIRTRLTGNSHFPGWWDVVPNDTSVVIVQGQAYKGRSVTIGREHYDNAAMVYVRPKAGIVEDVELNVKGRAGEEVRVLYYRLAPGAQFHESGGQVTVSNMGQSAGIGGDAHRRDVKLTIEPTKSLEAQAVNSHFDHYIPDAYNVTAQKAGQITTGKKGYNELGGGATEAQAQAKFVEPMTF